MVEVSELVPKLAETISQAGNNKRLTPQTLDEKLQSFNLEKSKRTMLCASLEWGFLREDKVMTKEQAEEAGDRHITAHHETLHALATLGTGNIVIERRAIPGPGFKGLTISLINKAKGAVQYFRDRVIISLAGRVGHELLGDTHTGGCWSDQFSAESAAREVSLRTGESIESVLGDARETVYGIARFFGLRTSMFEACRLAKHGVL